MSAINALPDMDEPRLRALGKQLNRNRKASLISTGRSKDKLDVYVKSLNKEQRTLDGKFRKNSVRLKHSLAHVRGTQKVLRARREQSFWEDSDEYPFGVYQGENLDSYRREIENVIESKHPKTRRKKKVEYNLNMGKVRGKIMNDEEAKHHFNYIMSKDRKKDNMNRDHTLTRPFYARSVPDKIADFYKRINPCLSSRMEDCHSMSSSPADSLHRLKTPNSNRTRVEKLKGLDSNDSSRVCSPSDVKVGSVVTTGSQNKHVNLPPIAPKKEHISNKSSDSIPRQYLPHLNIRRATKGDLTTLKGTKKEIMTFDRLKARRATTLL
ncbi:hypothetical protein ACF0H5_003035 [Mactra antiquata]